MKAKLTALAVTIFGILCLWMQKWLLTGLDEKGLLPGGHPASYVLAAAALAVLALLGVYFFIGPNTDFRIRTKLPLQAIGCLAAAAGHIYYAFSGNELKLFLILKVIAAICFLILAYYRVQGKKTPLVIVTVIAVTMMALCFGQYRVWSRNTQLYEYMFPALSALFLTLYSLEHCALEISRRKCKKAFVMNQAALFCTIACLSGPQWPYYLAMLIWLVSGLFVKPGIVSLPKPVQLCMICLEGAGYTVYAVGGCVRDSLLGLTPKDYDLCTNATPEDMLRVFDDYELVRAGEKHGTIGVVIDGKVYEITTYRTEGNYADNRHPDNVVFVDRLEEDLARRDFTINAMAYHPKAGLVDPYGGEEDLFSGVLRAVGDPDTRFQEDSLRILRGVRFACRFRLKIEKQTRKAMKRQAGLMANLAPERVQAELTQILRMMEQGDLVRFRDMIVTVIPELAPCIDFQQHNPHHTFDVFTHTDRVLAGCSKDAAVRWAALLHDVGKPQTFTQDASGKGHFYGHAKESSRIAQQVLTRLRASNALKEQVIFLIEHHMDTITAEKSFLRLKLSRYGSENLKKLIELQQADRGGKDDKPRKNTDTEKLLILLEKLEKEEGRMQLRDLAVDGYDLMALGFSAGPALGQCQRRLLTLVLEDTIPNEKEALLAAAKEILEASEDLQDA